MFARSKKKFADPKFEEMLPVIRRQARRAFWDRSPDEREELIAETIANAYCAYCGLIERGKAAVAYPTPLARFAIRQICAGRRVASRLNVHDVTSSYCQQAKGVCVEGLGFQDNTQSRWQEVVAEDKTAGPAEIAATRIDFAAWLQSLRPRMRRIAKLLAVGETTQEAAKAFELSPARISQIRGELRSHWFAYQGGPAVA